MKDWTLKQVLAAAPGRYCIGKSLYLIVTPDTQTRRFAFRYTKPGTARVTEAGLGKLGDITLAKAHDTRDEYRQLVRRGGDPVEQKREVKVEAKREAEAQRMFGTVVEDFIAVQGRRFRNPGSGKNMQHLLRVHAKPLAGTPIVDIGATHIKAALLPLWQNSPEQARRTIGMVLRVLRYGKAHGLAVANPSDVRDALKELLPRVPTAKKHHAAMDYRAVPAFMRELRAAQTQGEALSPPVIEFLVLTAAREKEACGIQWREFDWEQGLWILPATRSKTGREHRVPLCNRAIMLLTRQRWPNGQGLDPDPDSYVWPGLGGRKHITGKTIYKYLTQTMGVNVTIHADCAKSRPERIPSWRWPR
jgi:integrase